MTPTDKDVQEARRLRDLMDDNNPAADAFVSLVEKVCGDRNAAREEAHYANGVAEVAMRDRAEVERERDRLQVMHIERSNNYDALEAEKVVLVEALKGLVNEVSAWSEETLIAADCVTNARCLMRKRDEARAALKAAGVSE